MDRRGITMVELLLCMAIMGLLLAAASGPALGERRARQNLQALAIELSNDIRACRYAAMEEGVPYYMEIGANEYVVKFRAGKSYKIKKMRKWPSGIRYVEKKAIPLTFPITGIYDYLNNCTISLMNEKGQVVQVIISNGGRIRF